MALSKTHQALITKAKAVGGGELGVSLDDEICSYLLATIIADLDLRDEFPEFRAPVPPFFGTDPLDRLRVAGVDFPATFERLLRLRTDADAYFYCLATLHKARLKYERILKAQPIPTIEQVGPRGLLQFGKLSPAGLAGLLLWRKWVYDIDNRAAQETGYVFEPIIAYAIGGVPASAKKSPIKRGGTGAGRQVDCLRESDKRAYEFKLRVTIAASGQGRWGEELEFPADASASGYAPVLVVLDSTENPKLAELRNRFQEAGGQTYVGEQAWQHLEAEAGATMAVLLENYVRMPLDSLLDEVPDELPDFQLRIENEHLIIRIGDEQLRIRREPKDQLATGAEDLPEDISNEITPG